MPETKNLNWPKLLQGREEGDRMLKVLLVNPNRSRRAHDAAILKMDEEAARMLLASEPNAWAIGNQGAG